MLVAVPSDHWPVVDALANDGFHVVHVDRHIRAFLTELDPPISATRALANMASSPRLSAQLDELHRALLRWRQAPGAWVDVADEHRVTVSQHRSDEVVAVTHDVFDDCAERNSDLRRMIAVLRRMLPAPDFAALEHDTVIVGVDTDAQIASLPAEGVRYVCLADRRPLWASDVADLYTIDGGSTEHGNERAAAVVAAVRGLVTA
jgi:hypothetical protein